MASIKLTVNTNFADASKDIKSLGKLTEAETKRMDKGLKNLSVEQLDKFERNLKRSTAAIKATKGPTAAMQAQQRALSAQIQRSIRAGIDPLDDSLAKLSKQYEDVTKEVEQATKAQKKSEDQAKRNEQVMTALKVAVVAFGIAAAKAFFDFSMEAAEAASDAEEIAGKYNVVFRELIDGGEQMSTSLAKDFDLASSTAQKLLGDTGDLLTGFGLSTESAAAFADETNRLALDLASFTNAQGGATAVSKALTSAYANEREALKTYGIVINQAMVDTRLLENAQAGLTFESEKEAIAFATLSLATEQSKNAIGDYARTSESAANVSRRLEESQKALKEAFGAVVLEGLTPFRAELTEIIGNMAMFITQHQAAKSLLEDMEDGAIDSATSLTDLQNALAGLELQRNKYGTGYSKEVQREIDAVKDLIKEYNRNDAMLERINAMKELGTLTAKELAEIEVARLKVQTDAATQLATMQEANLTSSQRQINALQEQINYWVQFRDVIGVQELINELVGDRNKLMEEQDELANNLTNKLDVLQNAEAIAHNDRLVAYEEFLAARMEQEGIDSENRLEFLSTELARVLELETLSNEERLAAIEAFDNARANSTEMANNRIIDNYGVTYVTLEQLHDRYRARVSAIWKVISDIAMASADVTANALNVIINALGQWGGESKKAAALQKALGITSTIIATSSAMMNAYNALAGIPYVGPALGAAAAAAAGVAGAIQVAKIVNTPVPSAETGGRFTVPEASGATRSDNVGMNVNAGETVTVSPRGESGAGMITVNNYLDREVLWRVTQEGLDAGEVQVNNDNIREAV